MIYPEVADLTPEQLKYLCDEYRAHNSGLWNLA